jgi:hypothetical protein
MRSDAPMIEHGSNRSDRWLRVNRLRAAFAIAVVEGILVALDVIPWFAALLIAIIVLAVYFWWARERSSPTIREASWILAVSQALVALVPVFVLIVGTLALIIVGLLAVAALVVLFADRR